MSDSGFYVFILLNLVLSDFNETVAAGYRPGCIRSGADGFTLSVSIPVISLAGDIPPQALLAWDSRLLSKSQHLTLVLSGLRSFWPILQKDGQLIPQYSSQSSTNLTFRIGLTRGYKPSKDLVSDLVRQFALRGNEDVADESQQPEAQPGVFDDLDADELMDIIEDLEATEASEKQEDDAADEESLSTFHFSLSTSMESMMQELFFPVVQLRAQYNLGWAAAELLVAESRRKQQKPEDLLVEMIDVSDSLFKRTGLPHV